MDEIVKAAMAKWPDVPAVYGWLELTARGEWRIRGEPIANQALRDFISRNYAHDDRGNWYFQNGPQRVYVMLEATPFIYRFDEGGRLQSHTAERPVDLRGVFADEGGRLYLLTELGVGLLNSRDTACLAERIVDAQGRALDEANWSRWVAGESEAWLERGAPQPSLKLERIAADRLQQVLGFVAAPRP